MVEYVYNFLANLHPLFLLLTVIILAARSEALAFLFSREYNHSDLLSKVDLHSKVPWPGIWLFLQIIAVIVTIIGFTLQIGIYFGWFPESLA